MREAQTTYRKATLRAVPMGMADMVTVVIVLPLRRVGMMAGLVAVEGAAFVPNMITTMIGAGTGTSIFGRAVIGMAATVEFFHVIAPMAATVLDAVVVTVTSAARVLAAIVVALTGILAVIMVVPAC